MKATESPYRQITAIPTGLGGLDKILGIKGIPLRKITEVSGQWSTGKSTLAMAIVGEAQKLGHPTCWVDTEYSFDEETIKYATRLGVDCAALDLISEDCAEKNLDAIEEWVRANKNGLVVLDSVGGLLPRAEAEKGADGKVIGGQARVIATFCRKIVPLLAIQNTGLIALNHELTDIMTGRLSTSGGAKLAYHKSIWLRLKKANKRVMQGEEQVGEMIVAEVRKNKLAATLRQSCELQLMYGTGFSKGYDLIEAAKEQIFKKQGQFFYWGEEKIARGEAGLREIFKNAEFAGRVAATLEHATEAR